MKKNRKEVFTMKKQKMWKSLVIGLCISALTGCGTGADEKTEGGNMPATEYQSSIFDDEDMHSDENDNIAPKADNADGNNSQENKDSSLPDGNGTNGADASQENRSNITDNGTVEKVDAESLYASAAITGSVVEFSDDSCTVSAVVTEDDGKTGVVAAPGYESEDTNVEVTYQEGCVVQIATIYTSTGIAELEQTSVADIKKQSSVIIYGSFEDTHHVTATKVIICHRTA